MTEAGPIIRRRGQRGRSLTSTRTLAAAKRALAERALKGDPEAVALLLRLAGDLPDDFTLAADALEA